jgi:hypothetical protein
MKINKKEYIDKEVGHLKEIVNKERELDAKALVHQFNETERRLESLNHEAARLSLMIPKDQFDLVIDQLKKEGNRRDDDLRVIQLWISNQEGKAARSQLIAIASIIVSVIAIVLSFLKK